MKFSHLREDNVTEHHSSVSDIDAAIQLNPQLDVEALLLSAMLYSRDMPALRSIATHLSADHFNNPHHGRLFDTIGELVVSEKPHDPASVRGALIRHGGEQQAVLETLIMATTLGANDLEVKHYAAEVSSQAYRRSYHALAGSIEYAASAAPEARLFDILVEHGRAQRQLWNQHQSFCVEMGTSVSTDDLTKVSVRDAVVSRTEKPVQKATLAVSEKAAQGRSLIEVAGVETTPEAFKSTTGKAASPSNVPTTSEANMESSSLTSQHPTPRL